MPIAIEELDIDTVSEIQLRVAMARPQQGPHVLVLRFSGAYRDGSAGSPDARQMLGAARHALTLWDADALVLDLRHLAYRWGDGMLGVIAVDADPDLGPLPRTAAVSERCRPGLESLLAGGEGFLFDDLDQAIRAAAELAAEQQRLDEEHELSLKMYILIRESVPPGFAALAAAHAALAAYLRFRDAWEVRTWVTGLFRKVVCSVTDEEFERARRHEDHVVITESALDHREVALAFKPRVRWPGAFAHLRLYR